MIIREDKRIISLDERLPETIIVDNASLEVYLITINNSLTTTIELKNHARIKINNLVLGDNDIKIKVVHTGKESKSSIEAKNLVRGKSSFVAKTVIEEEARYSEAEQRISSLLLNPDASITALPILDIKNNEVIASHGTSIGTLDEGLLFYMRSRGLNCKEAKEAIIKGYVKPFLDLLDDQQKKAVEAVI